MYWFVTFPRERGDGKTDEVCQRFMSIEALFKWLQDWLGQNGSYPVNMSIYKGECVLDGSF